jgi:tRNA 5-methylaminomethyl-2-thiouridine biosynthesis bifunctional protein
VKVKSCQKNHRIFTKTVNPFTFIMTAPRPIQAIEPIFNQGLPYSPEYADIYHSRAGGLGQAQYVFLGGNQLPERWANTELWVILETGFGLGLNFLATWAAWRNDPKRPKRLHFISIEKHPFSAHGLKLAHTASGLSTEPLTAALSEQLIQAWPQHLCQGLHPIELEHGAITLTLALGDIQDQLPRLRLSTHSVFLDGFAPARNPDMWATEVMRNISYLMHDNATLATYTAASFVRKNLADMGFHVEKRSGYAGKREMTTAIWPPRPPIRRQGTRPSALHPRPNHQTRTAIVIGAGIAGCAITAELLQRGWHVTLVDQEADAARTTSGHRAIMVRPSLSADDNPLSRLSRHGFLSLWKTWQQLRSQGYRIQGEQCGAWEAALTPEDAAIHQRLIENLQLPESLVRIAQSHESQSLLGIHCPHSGLWFSESGWVNAIELCQAWLRKPNGHWRDGLTVHFSTRAERLIQTEKGWSLETQSNTPIPPAQEVILATSAQIRYVLQNSFPEISEWADWLPLRAIRGQLSEAPVTSSIPWPKAIVCGAGYVLPPLTDQENGSQWGQFGSSHGPLPGPSQWVNGDPDPTWFTPDFADHEDNHARLVSLLPNLKTYHPETFRAGLIGLRCVSIDRLPCIGAVPDAQLILNTLKRKTTVYSGAHLHHLPRISGLHVFTGLGSRAGVFSVLGAQLLAAQLEGEPLPIERDLVGALDPARFCLKKYRSHH